MSKMFQSSHISFESINQSVIFVPKLGASHGSMNRSIDSFERTIKQSVSLVNVEPII